MDYPIRFVEQLRPQIRALRKKRGLTQGELGHRLGVGQARIAEIERTPGTVSVDQMLKILSLLEAGLVLRDSEPEEAVAQPSGKSSPKPGNDAPKPIPRTRSVGAQNQQRLRRGSALVKRDISESSAEALKALKNLNVGVTVTTTSARNFVIKPKKGSW